ncbi:hypothetical protein ANN_21173 [Periplaneta americana]|uniref:Uncharacterized protein n=1 Tax=Periplaneta americana TaxID=6978 RepID=A0ABQ8SEQ7_PERAM|nr:hypothetical protein ANN_21173 [Periplaneta americana]
MAGLCEGGNEPPGSLKVNSSGGEDELSPISHSSSGCTIGCLMYTAGLLLSLKSDFSKVDRVPCTFEMLCLLCFEYDAFSKPIPYDPVTCPIPTASGEYTVAEEMQEECPLSSPANDSDSDYYQPGEDIYSMNNVTLIRDHAISYGTWH